MYIKCLIWRTLKTFVVIHFSVSDIVGVSDNKSVENGYYFCDSFGGKKVEFDASKCQISEFYNKKLDDKIVEASNRTDSPGKESTEKEIEL